MSDFGQIIAPYRVAPAQGGLDDLALFLQRREMTDQSQVQSALAQATRAYLAQQQGLPQGVDPAAIQQFGIAGDTNTRAWNADTRAGAQEGRQAQDHQSRYDFADKFVGALPEQEDPYLRALQLGGGPYGAEGLSGALGGQFSRQGELAARGQMNDADNIAAQQRLETELRMKAEAAVAEQMRQQGVETDMTARIQKAWETGQATGNWSSFMALVPNAAGSPVMYDREETTKSEAKTRADAAAVEDAHRTTPPPSPIGTIQEDPEVRKARLNSMFPGMTPEQIVQQVIKGTEGFGGDFRYKAVREEHPDLYNEAWKARQLELEQIKRQEVIDMIEGRKPLPRVFQMGMAQ